MRDHYEFGFVTLTFHPHVIGRGHRKPMLKRLLRRLGQEGAPFVTMQLAILEFCTRYSSGTSLRPLPLCSAPAQATH